MCGRYSVASDFRTWGIQSTIPGFRNTVYNATPGSFLPVLRKEKELVPELMRWGLVPHWNQGSQKTFATFNARSETVSTSPAFRDSFFKRRCLIPAIGFYEWKHNEDGTKSPYFFRMKKYPYFAMAGIWDSWKDQEGKELRTYSIITTTPNDLMAPIHSRMPVIIQKEIQNMWLSSETTVQALQDVLKPCDSSIMEAYRVSKYVSDTRIDNPTLIKPIDEDDK